jgi:hypothetical protein
MVFFSYGGGVFIWQKQKPHRRFGSGVWKALVNESKPDRRAAQQRLKQQVQIQITIHTVLIGYFAGLVKFIFPFHSPNCPVSVSTGAAQTRH